MERAPFLLDGLGPIAAKEVSLPSESYLFTKRSEYHIELDKLSCMYKFSD